MAFAGLDTLSTPLLAKKIVCDLPVPGRHRRGRPMKSWMICIEKEIKDCNLSQVDPKNRVDWRKASQLLPTPAAGAQVAI